MQTFYQSTRSAWRLLPLLCLFGLPEARAQQGKSGAGSITAANTVVNEYTALTADAAAGSATISVTSSALNANSRFAANLAPGDLVMLIQMQGATISTADDATYGGVTSYNNAGHYELREVASVPSATSITFTCGLTNGYTSNGHVQVVRVPRYSTLTLNANTSVTAPAWNGTTGGIVALEVQGNTTLGNNAYIDVSGMGFRGGAIDNQSTFPSTYVGYRTTTAADGAEKGEGIAGYEAAYAAVGRYGRGPAANGGGGGNGHNAGGGGGSNVGGTGTWTGTGIPVGGYNASWNRESANFATSSSPGGGRGGYSYSATDQDASVVGPGTAGSGSPWGGDQRRNVGGFGGRPLDATGRLFLGGGGGAGDQNDGTGTAGAAGGGLIYLFTGGTITGSGTGTSGLKANGAAAATAGYQDAAGGGGGGGTIVINTAGTLAAFGVSAAGGAGGSQTGNAGDTQAEGPGGGGGGGLVQSTATLPAAATLTGGTSGSTTSPSLTEFPPNGATQGAAGLTQTITYNAQCTVSTLVGTVFEDVNYGGGAGRPSSAGGTAPRAGARVELYDANKTFVAATTTAANGQYSFEVVPGASYTVRVVNSTVSSSRTGYVAGLLPVQTYNGTTTAVGGMNPALADAGNGTTGTTLASLTTATTIAQSQATVTASGTSSTTGPDFGFNFDVVVNTNDADQGSLRQFILNANALGGENSLAQAGFYSDARNLSAGTAAGRAGVPLPTSYESSIFMIPASALTNAKVAVITPATALPQLTGANTVVNGATQTYNIGNTNDGLLGAGGTVGTQATPLSQLSGPEVQLTGTAGVAAGLNVAGAGSRVRGLAVYGFGSDVNNDGVANILVSANNVLLADNVIGNTATNFSTVPAANNNTGVRVLSGTGVSLTNNLIGFAGGSGAYVAPAVTGVSFTGNEIRGNARLNTIYDGIDSHGSGTVVTNNLFADGSAQGFDSYSSAGSNNLTGNTFTNNGIGNATSAPVETAGARLYGTGNTFSQNLSYANYGDGVEVVNNDGTNVPKSTAVISRNSIYNNGTITSLNGTGPAGDIGLDLLAAGENGNTGNAPYVTLNSANTNGANNLQNYPVITSAVLSGSNLLVSGYAKAGAVIELFAAQPNAAGLNATGANFGQGKTYLTTVTEGTNDADARTGLSYSGPINGFNQGADTNANGFSFSIPLSALPGGTLAAGTVLTSTATLGSATSEFSGNATLAALTGYVYEDVNYGGGAGRPRSAGGTAGRPGATVELYNASGALVGTTTTDANGLYTFGTTPGTYTVRVVNSSVSSSRPGAVAGLLPVQTYNGTTTAVGGVNPAFSDAAANTGTQTLGALTSGTTTPESIATVTTTSAATSGPDFGFNFDVVVNTNDAGQGSLRQFILNANALGGETSLAQAGSNAAGALPASTETSIFMIPAGKLNASGVAVISPASALPVITGPNTSLDATTQTFNIGNTNAGTLGAGGSVGTAATALATVNRPEVQLVGSRNFDGVAIGATNAAVRGLSLYGFDHDITVNTDISAFLIEQNVVGTSATSFTDPGAGVRTLNEGILLNDADNGTVRNNLIGYNGGMGVWVLGNGNGSNGNTISGNEIRGNAQESRPAPEGLVFDGLELQGNSTNNTVSGNLITANYGHGIDSFGNDIGGNTVSGNTISNNGVGVATNMGEEGSGLRVFGNANPTIISQNVLSGNNGSGVLVIGSANQVTISQNSTFGNTRLGIDLLLDNSTPLFYNGNTGATSNVTLNDNGDTDGGGNGQLNFPVLTSATLNATANTLTVSGYARSGALVELFLATPLATDPTNSNKSFGQGSSFLVGRTEGNATDDSNPGTGTYGAGNAPVNGVYQGTDNTNLFTFSIPLGSLTAAQRTALLGGSAVLTSTATLANSTSEFSANLAVPAADVTVALNGPATVSPGQPAGPYTATFTNEGPGTATSVTRTVTLPAGATNIFVNGVAYTPTTANTIDFGPAATLASGASNAFTFTFTPATSATGSVAITGTTSTTSTQAANAAPDASTISATVAPVANVAATIAAVPAGLAAGTPAATGGNRFSVTFSNNGPNAASGVVASVQLPAGLTNVSSTNNSGGVYNATTGVLTYPGITSLAGGGAGNVSSTITFDVPAINPASVGTAAGTLVASARIATTTNEAGQTTDNAASATLSVTPAFDLVTTISGPTTAVAGNPVTLAVTTTNNGPSATTGVVQTVQLVPGLSNVYVSNGGVYNPATSTQSLTVNGVGYSVPAGAVVFPPLVGMPSGQTVANSVTFAQPTSSFAPSASVTPNAAGTATTAGDTNPANNTAYLNGSASAANITTQGAQSGTANAYTTLTTSAATTTLGSPVTLTVTTGNNGPSQATGTPQLVQLVPGFDVTTLKINNTTGTLSGNTITFSTGGPKYDVLTGLVTFPALSDGTNGSTSGTSVTNTITLTPTAATAGRNGRLVPMATVQTTNTDPVPADNVASVGITLAQSADLATTISGPATALAGQAVTYTASFVNNGPTVASNVAQTVQLPAGLGAVTITDAAGNAVSGASYNPTTGLVTLPNTTLDPSGATQVYKLTLVAPAQSFSPGSRISSPTSDPSSTNNSASTTTTVTPAADLATVVSGPATAVIGNAVTYAVTTTNNGPAAATNAAPTLQLPAGFDATTLRVDGTTGVLSGSTITYTLASGATATYSTTTGLVTFPTAGSLPSGSSVSNYATFVMPNAAGGQVAGLASASASGNTDPTSANNSASVGTSIAPTTTTSADLVATLSAASGTVAVGGTVAYTATYSNAGTDPAVNVTPTLQLLPGLTATTLPSVGGSAGTLSNGVITFPNGATYSQQTGVLTFPTIASQATGAANAVSYNVQVVAPANGPLLATAATTSSTSEPNTAAAQANDVQSASVSITPSFNEVTSVSGPATAVAGSSQTYTVTTTNNGPSATSNATTQTVTVPAGQTPTNITGGGTYSSANNTITWTIPAGQSAGVNGAAANSFTIVQPTTATTLTAAVTVTGESNTGDNTFSLTTSPTNLTPLAYTMVNTLQNPQSNDAGGLTNGLLISPLNASDPENSFATQKYTIASIPTSNAGGADNQGTLYYNDGTTNGAYSAVTVGQTLTDAQAKTLRFKAAAGFVGNASFTYTTTDAAGNTSLAANYTIPVESDLEATTYTLTPVKGGSNGAYVAGDVIAYATDTNGAVYNAATGKVYQNNGQPQAGTVASGIVAATTGAFTSSDPSVTSLSSLGLTMQPDGRLVVSNPNALRAGNYTVQVTTTDANGGTTTQTVSFTIPAYPLPVVLADFMAQTVQNRDALLTWKTASEKNNDHFELERSFDGSAFTKVGQMAGHGTTTAASAYSFNDAGVGALASGPVYYRLRQVDVDGSASFSPVRTVSFSHQASATPVALSLYPNPAQARTRLDLSQLPATGTYLVTLLDATGRTVLSRTLAGGLAQPLDVQGLASGTYLVRVSGQAADGTAFQKSLRLTKE